MPKLLIYSNQAFVRCGVRCFLDKQDGFHILRDSEVPEGRTLDIKTDGVVVVILDLDGLPNPIEVIRRIRREMHIRPSINNVRILIMCSASTTNLAVNALDTGAAGIITHSCEPADLIVAISRVLNGDNYIQPDIAMDIFRELRANEERRSEAERLRLTVREGQVIDQLLQGKTNRQIGQSLSISEKTVKHYVGVLKEKFCVANRLELVLHAQRLSL